MPEEQSTQTSEIPQSPKFPDWPKIILATVLGFGLLVGAIYAGYWYGAQQTQQVESPVAAYQLTPTPITEPTNDSNWNLYTNKEYGFSVEYPAGWEVSIFTDNPDAPTSVIRKAIGFKGPLPEGVEIKHPAYNYVWTVVDIWRNPAERPLLEWLEKDTFPGHYKDGKYLGTPIPQTANVEVGGVPAFQGFYPESSQAYAHIETFFSYKDKVFRVLYLESDGGKSRDIYDRMLLTFRFLD